MLKKLFFVGVLSTGLVGSIASAQSFQKELWECTFTKHQGWISPTVAVVVESATTARVIDAFLIRYEQSPKKARVYRNDDRVLGVRWSIEQTTDKKGQRANKLDYDLRFNKQRNKASLDMKPFGFDNSFNGRGTCKLREE